MKHIILYGYLLFHIQASGIKLTSNVINYSIAIVFNVLNCIKILGEQTNLCFIIFGILITLVIYQGQIRNAS